MKKLLFFASILLLLSCGNNRSKPERQLSPEEVHQAVIDAEKEVFGEPISEEWKD